MIIPICIALTGFAVFVVCCLLDVLFPHPRVHLHRPPRAAVGAAAGPRAIESAPSRGRR